MMILAVFFASLVGAFIGGYLSHKHIGKVMGRDFSRAMVKDMNEYLKKEEIALNEKIKRKMF